LTIFASRGLLASLRFLLSLTQLIFWIIISLGIHQHALLMAAMVMVAQAVCLWHQNVEVLEQAKDIPLHKGKKRWGHKRRIYWYRTLIIHYSIVPNCWKQLSIALAQNFHGNKFIWLAIAVRLATRLYLNPVIYSFLSIPKALPPLGVVLLCTLASLAGLIAWESRHCMLAWQQTCRKDTRMVSLCAISIAAALLCLSLSNSSTPMLQGCALMAQGLAVTSTVTPVVRYGVPDVDAKVQQMYCGHYLQNEATSSKSGADHKY
jgi:hypothetical protein